MPAPRPCDTASTRQPAGVARKHAEAKEKKGRMGAQFLVRATSLLSEQCHTSALAVRCTQIGAMGSSAPSSSGRSSVLSWCTPEQILSLPVSLPYLFSLFSCIFFPSNSIFTVFFTLSQFPDTPFRLPSNLVFENVGKSCSRKQLGHIWLSCSQCIHRWQQLRTYDGVAKWARKNLWVKAMCYFGVKAFTHSVLTE